MIKQEEPIICPKHGNNVYPFWSKKSKDWFAICNFEFPKTHFIKINEDLEYDHGFRNQFENEREEHEQQK